MKETTDLKRAVQMAEQSIYDGARNIGKWNGFDVYEPMFADNEPRFIGFPQFILAKGNTMRWTYDDTESRSIMREISPHDEI